MEASLTSFSPMPNNSLRVSVSDPQKHGEGSTAFVTYLVQYKTLLENYSVPESKVRRRFQDFIWLYKNINDEFPACILPPLPDKHVMEYLTGDRFSPEFIERRRACLEIFLRHMARHPVLQKSVSLVRFLDTSDMTNHEPIPKNKESQHLMENIGDAILNVFSRVKTKDPKFLEIKEKSKILEDVLIQIEKNHSKIFKAESIMADSFKIIGNGIASLAFMETQMANSLSSFGTRLENYSNYVKSKSLREEMEYVLYLRHYAAYCESLKEVLKARDQRQIDHEELAAWYESYSTERDRTAGGKSAGGIAGFFKDKINDFKGIDPEKARQSRVEKLTAKVNQLENAVVTSQKEAEEFSEHVLKEVEIFNALKIQDFFGYLRDLTDIQIDFHQKGLQFWENMIPLMDNMGSESDSSL